MNAQATEASQTGWIRVEDLSVRFSTPGGEVLAVDNTTIDVKPGEFVTLIGPSGCGKSTLLNVAAGFIKGSSGQVTIDGKPVAGPSIERGVVFQQYSLFPGSPCARTWSSVCE